MDNFRKHKAPLRPVNGAVDGFGRSGRQVRLGPTARKRDDTSRLDNFKQSDGFHPNTRGAIQSSGIGTPPTTSARPVHKAIPSTRLDMQLPGPDKKKKKRSKKRIVLRSFLIFVVILVLAGGFMFGNAYLKARKIFGGGGNAPALDANVSPSALKGEGDGRVNILMLGIGGDGHEGADLTDTILIASIDPIQKQMSLMSIPRDFYVPTTGNYKINAVYSDAKQRVLSGAKTADIQQRAEAAGEAAIQSKIEEVTGIPMHYRVVVDFAAFEKAVNIVGGVDLNIDASNTVYEQMYDESTHRPYILDVRAGPNHFDGQRALFYSRSRHTSPRGDFDRSERQRLLLVALKNKVMSAGTYGNPVKITQLINDFGSHVHTNFSTGEILRVYDIVKGIDSSKIGSVDLVTPPNILIAGAMVNGNSVQQPKAGPTNYSDIQSFVRNTLKDGFIQNENASIAVYNGSETVGLAAKKATELKSFGYNITTIANAPNKNYQQTLLVDMTGGQKKYTQHYLEQRLKVTSISVLPDVNIKANGADFVIILGKNESTN